MKNNQELQMPKKYTKEEIQNAAIIMHPEFVWYDITVDDICMLFE